MVPSVVGLLDAEKAVLLGRPGRPVDPQGQPLDPAQEFGDAILGYRTWPPSRPARTVPACATRLSVTSDLNPALGRPPARRIRASCSPSVVVTAWSLHAMAVKRVPAASPRRPRDTPRGPGWHHPCRRYPRESGAPRWRVGAAPWHGGGRFPQPSRGALRCHGAGPAPYFHADPRSARFSVSARVQRSSPAMVSPWIHVSPFRLITVSGRVPPAFSSAVARSRECVTIQT